MTSLTRQTCVVPTTYSIYGAKVRFSEVIWQVRNGKTATVSYRGEPVDVEVEPWRALLLMPPAYIAITLSSKSERSRSTGDCVPTTNRRSEHGVFRAGPAPGGGTYTLVGPGTIEGEMFFYCNPKPCRKQSYKIDLHQILLPA